MIPRASRFLELDTPLNGARTPSAWANREEFSTRLRFLAGENTEQLAERWFLADRDVNALPDEPVTLVVATLMRLVASLLFPEWLSPGEGRADKSFIQDFFARTWRQAVKQIVKQSQASFLSFRRQLVAAGEGALSCSLREGAPGACAALRTNISRRFVIEH